ncbi:MAG TPA: hypothetical protein PLF40_07200 [Kofleriaceae bacterium]|nr:hypothetical protein [Kofleriaceae bacterium]
MNRTSNVSGRIFGSLSIALALSLAAVGCKKKDEGGAPPAGAKATEAGGTAAKAEPAVKAPATVINEADWELKDLHSIAPLINVSMKVPKTAKLEKNGNGGVDITISPTYMLTVSSQAVSNIKEAMDSEKSYTVGNSSYINGKVLSEEPNGFVYTYQMKTEENGNTYQPEAHFAYYLEKDGAIYAVTDPRSLDAFSTPGSAWTEDNAKKVYAIVKASAKIN